jgi:hypothetical protein
VDDEVLDGVAHARPLHLGVEADALGHRLVGARVDVEMANALEVLDHGNAALFHDHALECLTAARDDDVDAVVAPEEGADDVASAVDELHRIRRQSRGPDLGADRRRDGRVRRARLGAALQEDGVGGLEAEPGGVGRDVRARFEDREHDADRDAHLRDLEAVRPLPRRHRLADGLRQRRDLLEAARHRRDAVGVERQAVDEGRGLAARARLLDVAGVGREDRGFVTAQARGRGTERGVADGGRAPGKGPCGRAGGVRKRLGGPERIVGKRGHRGHSISAPRAGASSARSSRWMISSLPL